jgi:hypothetical protein
MTDECTTMPMYRLERVQQKWKPVLRPDTRQNKHLEQDDGNRGKFPGAVVSGRGFADEARQVRDFGAGDAEA